jgi:hypothetical protein
MLNKCGRGARWLSHARHRRWSIEPLEDRIALSGTSPKVVDVAVSSTEWAPAVFAFLAPSDPNETPIGGYRIPTGSNAQTAALPWNNLDQIKIRFDVDVDVQAADLALTGKNTNSYVFESFFYDPQTKVATWTLAAPIGKDRLLLDLDANGIDPVTDLAGNVLDGEWANNSSTFASGNGTPGGDFEFLLNVLPGEVNNTTQVTSLDYVLTRNQGGKSTTSAGYNFKCDVNGSGLIDSTDWQFVQSKMGNTLPSGNPTGVGNDAPTNIAFIGESIATSASVAVSLWSNFADAESGASGLTYAISGNTAPGLFSSVSINQSTGQLTIASASGVSGRANISVTATDSGGVSTRSSIPIDVGYDNQPPIILFSTPSYQPGGTWHVYGTVSDDEDVTGSIVVFYGVFEARAAVYPDGTFAFDVILGDIPYDQEFAITVDRHGESSNEVEVPVGL